MSSTTYIPFKLKKLISATAVGFAAAGCLTPYANAYTEYKVAKEGSNEANVDLWISGVEKVGLNNGSLGNSTLNNPGASLKPGTNMYDYVAITFTPTTSGEFSFGQISSPVDTVMVFYNGIYDPSNPGLNAIVGNDDTPQQKHRDKIGDQTINTMCGSVSYCPQITQQVQAGYTYTLWVSLYSYSRNLDLPFKFYSTGDAAFTEYTGRSPIDKMLDHYLASDLGQTVDPKFMGGTLRMDKDNAVYLDGFELSHITTSTIDQNGTHSIFAGVLSDLNTGQPGHISIDNSGTGGSVTFDADNTYTGSTTLKGGTLMVSRDENLGASSAKLVFNGGILQTNQSFQSARDIELNPIGGGNNDAGTINVMGNTTLDLSGVITGSGDWNKEGAGTLALNAANTYTGTTNVRAGRLLVGGSAADSAAQIMGDVNVTNAVLGGHGRVNGLVTVGSGGVIAPGSSIGQLRVGQLIFQSGSTYQFEADTDTSADQIIVDSTLGTGDGSATIQSGANLSILAGAGTWSDGVTYTILTADGGVTGTFDHVQKDMAFLDHQVIYNANDILLKLQRNDQSFGSVGTTPNENNAGAGIESLEPDHPIYKNIVSMNSFQARDAFNHLSGEIHASIKSAALSNGDYVRKSVNQHLLGKGDGINTQQIDDGKGLWVSTWGHKGHIKADRNAAKIKNDGWGVLAGADLFNNNVTTAGVALGFEQNTVKADEKHTSKADVDTIHLMAYGKTSAGPIDLRGGLGYSWLSADTSRTIQVPGLYAENKAKYDGSQVQLFIEGSHTFKINPQLSITPYDNLAYQRVKFDNFHEKGGISSLNIRNGADHVTSNTLGVRGQVTINPSAQLYADVGWKHNFNRKSPKVKANFIGGMPFSIAGNTIDENSAQIGLGADLQIRSNMNLRLGYEGNYGNKSRDHGAKLQWEMSF